MRKLLRGVCAAVLAFSVAMLLPVRAEASVNHSQSEAVAWANARANEGWNVDYDGAYGVQCVDLILAYYDYLVGWHTSGNAIDYSGNTLPAGWTRVYSDPHPGDVIVWNRGAQLSTSAIGGNEWADSSYGHIGIVTEVRDGYVVTVETNTYSSRPAAPHNRIISGVACYIRPDFVQVRGCLDASRGENGQIYVRGWAFDGSSPSTSINVHVYVGGSAGSGAPCYAITANKTRDDVNSAYGVSGAHGFEATIVTTQRGTVPIYLYAIAASGNGPNPEFANTSVTISSAGDPVGNFEVCEGGPGYYHVKGWGYDPDVSADSISVHVYVDGTYATKFDTNVERADVNSAKGITGSHGFDQTIRTGLVGSHTVELFLINSGAGGGDGALNPSLGKKTVNIIEDTQAPTVDSITIVEQTDERVVIDVVATDNYAAKIGCMVYAMFGDTPLYSRYVPDAERLDSTTVRYTIALDGLRASCAADSYRCMFYAVDDAGNTSPQYSSSNGWDGCAYHDLELGFGVCYTMRVGESVARSEIIDTSGLTRPRRVIAATDIVEISDDDVYTAVKEGACWVGYSHSQGYKVVKLIVVPATVDLSGATVALPYANAPYTGKAITPSPTVTFDGATLIEGADYEVSYANNVSVGTATVTVTGIGSYEGTATATFRIARVAADGWYTFPDGFTGYGKGGKLVTGWLDLGGAKYWFDDQGRMATGWTDLVVDGKTMHYYFRPSGNLARGSWADIDGVKYYFRPSGNMATGWADIEGKKYFFDESGQMVTGWRDIDNGQGATNHYYFRPSGSMATGWAQVDGESYYFRPSGNMATGFTDVTDDAYKRYFDESGRMLTGWQEINGNTYYFRSSGAMQTGTATIDGMACTFTDKGVLVLDGASMAAVPAAESELVVAEPDATTEAEAELEEVVFEADSAPSDEADAELEVQEADEEEMSTFVDEEG